MEVQVAEIDDESGPENIENWDSFKGLILFDSCVQNITNRKSIFLSN
jgi:hypothetical protein